jgi:hypothetical protein
LRMHCASFWLVISPLSSCIVALAMSNCAETLNSQILTKFV